MVNKKTQNKEKVGVNPIVAGVTGAVIGAVAGAAVVLNDEKNREKVKDVLMNVKDQALSYIEDIQKQVQSRQSEAGEELAVEAGKVKKRSTFC